MKAYIYKGQRPSNGARALQETLGATMMRSEGSVYRGRPNTMVINWGTTNAEAERLAGIAPLFLNKPQAVSAACNKLTFMKLLEEAMPLNCLPYTEDFSEACKLAEAGGRIFARTVLNGHSGSGIQLMVNINEAEIQAIRKIRDGNLLPVTLINGVEEHPAALVNCKLFTQGITGRRDEFRVHVVNGKAILSQIKLRKEGHADNPLSNTVVRNVQSGWVYGVNTVEDHPAIEEVRRVAIEAVAKTGLDFGAVDLVWKQDGARVYVLEINTAPGLAEEGSALEKYTEAFKEYV